jgi:hypothetical protein
LQLDTSGSTQAFDQLGVHRAQASHDVSGRRDPQRVPVGVVDASVQRGQPAQQRRSQQTVTDLVVGLPIDEHLAAPQTRLGAFVMVAQVGRQRRGSVGERGLDLGQTGLEVQQR